MIDRESWGGAAGKPRNQPNRGARSTVLSNLDYSHARRHPMKKAALVLTVAVAGLLAGLSSLESAAPPPKPKRINRAIELLEAGQPIYYTQITTTDVSYEKGKEMAQTWADYISLEMEHGAYNIMGIRAFMRGLVDGGPTKSGHRTPTVISTLPVGGIDEYVMRANYWMVEQVLSSGVHGILLCHARSPEAVSAFVQAARYPHHKTAGGLGEGLRGAGSQSFASKIWGISVDEYTNRAEPWPLDPNGKSCWGSRSKIVTRYRMPKPVSPFPHRFAEWGPGDMGLSHGIPGVRDSKIMQAARNKVFSACKRAKIAFLNGVSPQTVIQMLDEGVMVGSGSRQAAEIGRKHTKRKMPW